MAAQFDSQRETKENYSIICERFQIDSLTEDQMSALDNIRRGNDVFLCLRTGGGKSLTYESYPLLFPNKSVIVIAPLITIMDEQCKKLNKFGLKATYIGQDRNEDEQITSGGFQFVFGSPEHFLHGRYREMLRSSKYKSELGLIVVDEAHTVIQWGEASREEIPFRESFSKIGELRSLCPDAQILALTATAGPTQRRKIMKSLCFKKNATIINESADRQNIKISSMCISNMEPIEITFKWLLHDLCESGLSLPRHVIFCESISDVSKIYSSFTKALGQKSLQKHVEMYHSKTNDIVKDKIRSDMATNGNIRVLICTNAAGMGVNFWGVYHIIHYGLPRLMDTFVQQMGRAGRDGSFSQELIIFKPHKGHLSKVETELVKLAKDTQSCRHQVLCDSYLNSRVPINPRHNCCDVCDKTCECGTSQCPNQHRAFVKATDSPDPEDLMERPVSDRERKHLKQKLCSLKYALTEEASSSYIEADLHSFSEGVINDIVEKCNQIFTVSDVMRMFPIWSYNIARQLFSIINEVFGDSDMYALSDPESSESDS